MAGAATSDPRDREFAEQIGHELSSSSGGASVELQVRSWLEAGQWMLSQIEPQVSHYLDVPALRIRSDIRRSFAAEVGAILQSIEITSATGVPTLVGMDNGFDINPVVNVIDYNTLSHLNLQEAGPYSLIRRARYAPSKAEHNPRIELTDAETARRGLFTLVTDSLRFLFGGPGGGPPRYIRFTVYTTKLEYVLNSIPEWAGTYTRFGNSRTSPVTGNLRSQRYYFEGRKGPLVEEDRTLVVVTPANTSTHLNW